MMDNSIFIENAAHEFWALAGISGERLALPAT